MGLTALEPQTESTNSTKRPRWLYPAVGAAALGTTLVFGAALAARANTRLSWLDYATDETRALSGFMRISALGMHTAGKALHGISHHWTGNGPQSLVEQIHPDPNHETK